MAAKPEDLTQNNLLEPLADLHISDSEEEKKKKRQQEIFAELEVGDSPLFPKPTAAPEATNLDSKKMEREELFGNASATTGLFSEFPEKKSNRLESEIGSEELEEDTSSTRGTPGAQSVKVELEPLQLPENELEELEEIEEFEEIENSEESESEQDETSQKISNGKIALAVIAGSFLVAGTVALFVFFPPAGAVALAIGAKIGTATSLTAAAHAAIPLVVAAAKVAGSAILGAATTAGSTIAGAGVTAGGAITGAGVTAGSTITSVAATAGSAITHAAGVVAHAAMPVANVAKAAGDIMAQAASTAAQTTIGRLALTATAGIATTGAIKGMGSLLSTAAKKIQDLGSSKDTDNQNSQEMGTGLTSTPTAAN